MKFLLLSFTLELASMSLPEVMSWEDWLDEFSSRDNFIEFSVTPENHADRWKIYNDNINFIKEHNAREEIGLETFRLGVNQFSAMTYREWNSSVLGCLIPRTRPAVPSPEVIKNEMIRRGITGNATSIDWRQKNVVTAVKNQGSCGSCWAFSATGSIEVAVAIETGNLISLSEQQMMDCSKQLGDASCEGGLMDNAFTYVEDNHGLDTEADYPYEMRDESCKTRKERIHASTIRSFHDIRVNDEGALARAVQIGAVSVAIEADQASFMMYRSGIYTAKCGTALDHGVLVVGYGTSKYGQDYWIVKNSWGPQWGEEGYIKMERNVEEPSGKCGIAIQASYPIAGPQPKHYPTIKPTSMPSPPSPSPKNYERPIDGICHYGEFAAMIQNVPGSMCLPKCRREWFIFEVCPKAPIGFLAAAECLLETPNGSRLCVLICDVNDPKSCRPDEGCYCRAIQGNGICTYDDKYEILEGKLASNDTVKQLM